MVDGWRWNAPAMALSLALLGCGGRVISGLDRANDTVDGGISSGPSSGSGGSGNSGGKTSGSGSSGSSPTTGSGSGQGGSSSVTVSSVTTGGNRNTEILFVDGWAPLDANDFGIQGAFWTAEDGNGSYAEFYAADAGSSACAGGVATQVLPDATGTPDWGGYWGAMLGFNLAQDVGTDAAFAYDARAHGVTGFGFAVEGPAPLPFAGDLRFNVKVAGDDNIYCARVPVDGPQTFALSSLRQNCWENDPSAPTPDPTRLESIQWHYVTNTSLSYAFDLCITRLWVVTE